MNILTHKEMTAHIRKLIKRDGIKARVRMFSACGVKYIQIIAPSYEDGFTADEISKFAHIAICNKLTHTQGFPINISIERQLTGKDQFNYVYNA